MQDKEQQKIETILKNSANEIQMKPFDERWKDIESKLDFESGTQAAMEKVPALAAQGANGYSFNGRLTGNAIKIIVIVTCIFMVLALAIILPICLSENEQSYFTPTELSAEVVTEDNFYSGIRESKIDLVDLTKYQCQDFSLLKTESGEVHGGNFSVYNKNDNEIVKVIFFSEFVKAPNYDFSEPEIYKLGNVEIQYKMLEGNEDGFHYNAYAIYKGVTYKIDYFCLTDNVLNFFDNFFE